MNASFLTILVLASLTLVVSARPSRRPATLVEKATKSVSDALTAPPKDNEVCFSPDESCDVKVWKFLQSATKSVDVAIFDITHPKIVHELLVASKRVPVRVVADRRQSKGEHSLVSTLLKGGIDVRLGRQRGIMHNKFIVVDGTRLVTGSFNFTNGASEKNQENQVYLSTPEILHRYRERYERIWSEGKSAKRDVSSGE